MTLQETIVTYLDAATQMQVATTVNGRPWCATVYFAADNAHNLYWISPAETRHSRELVENGYVAGAIVAPLPAGQPPRGIQFEGVAQEITDSQEIIRLAQAYTERYNRPGLGEEIAARIGPNRLYKITPTVFYYFDQSTNPDQPQQTWTLTDTGD